MSTQEKSKKFYITTSIDYVNGRPHIGHALEKIQADVLARYHRVKGDDVWFLTGTDEHGLKIYRAAEKEGKNISDFVNINAASFRDLKSILNLSWDDFIQTSDQKKHWPGVQKIWNKIKDSGDLYKKKYKGIYCVGHEAFITGKDLVDGKCPDHQKAPEEVEQENWFFRLSKYTKEIEEKIKSQELKIIPEARQAEILSLLKDGLEDVSFSRMSKDLPWGVPVPGDEEHTIYVWCDALANYITAIGYGREEDNFNKWWPADLHVIGKDIFRFHAAIWPGMLLSAGLPLPKAIFVHGFITVEGQKMSKSVGNVIDPADLVKKYGIDSVRYYLLKEIPTGEDGDFSNQKFIDRHNGDLVNGLGNLVSRVTTLGEKLSPIDFSFTDDVEQKIKEEIEKIFSGYEKAMRNIQLHEALAVVWKLISFSDKYINDKKPWKTTDVLELNKTMVNSSYLIGVVANLLEPFLPYTAEKIKENIQFKNSRLTITKGPHLFSRIQ